MSYTVVLLAKKEMNRFAMFYELIDFDIIKARKSKIARNKQKPMLYEIAST